jgi:glycosyltransferase involved in cell wall biosynthesis
MSAKKPLVSILMAVYNGEKYLREAIESMLNQTYMNFEFLIINDGSTDATEEIILSYNDERIRYIRNEQNLKLIASLNKGLDLAKGKYIARMDADDISLPRRLEKQVEFMERNSDIGVLGSWVQTLGLEKDREIHFKSGNNQIRFELFIHNYLHHPTVMLRNDILEKYNIKYEQYLHAEDYAFWIKLSNYTKIDILPEILLIYRLHGNNISEIQVEFQKKQTSEIRRIQLSDLGMYLSDNELTLYESFIDDDLFYTPDEFKKILNIIQLLIFRNNEKKMLDVELLFSYFDKKVNDYIELNSYRMKKEINDYFKSIFVRSVKNQLKIKVKNKLGLKRL